MTFFFMVVWQFLTSRLLHCRSPFSYRLGHPHTFSKMTITVMSKPFSSSPLNTTSPSSSFSSSPGPAFLPRLSLGILGRAPPPRYERSLRSPESQIQFTDTPTVSHDDLLTRGKWAGVKIYVVAISYGFPVVEMKVRPRERCGRAWRPKWDVLETRRPPVYPPSNSTDHECES